MPSNRSGSWNKKIELSSQKLLINLKYQRFKCLAHEDNLKKEHYLLALVICRKNCLNKLTDSLIWFLFYNNFNSSIILERPVYKKSDKSV